MRAHASVSEAARVSFPKSHRSSGSRDSAERVNLLSPRWWSLEETLVPRRDMDLGGSGSQGSFVCSHVGSRRNGLRHRDVEGVQASSKANVLINSEDGVAYIWEVVDERRRRFLVVADYVWDAEVLEELKKAGAWVLYTTRRAERASAARSAPERGSGYGPEEGSRTGRRPAPSGGCVRSDEEVRVCGMDLVLVGRRGEFRERFDERVWRNVLGRIMEAQEEGEVGQLWDWRAAVFRAGLRVLAGDNPLNKELYLALALLPMGLAFPPVAWILLCDDDDSSEELQNTANKVLEVLERLSIVALEGGGHYRVHATHAEFVWDCLLRNQETRDNALPRWRKYVSSVEVLNTYTSAWLLKIWDLISIVGEEGFVSRPCNAALDEMDPSNAELPNALEKVAEFHIRRQDWWDAYAKYSQLLRVIEGAADGDDLAVAYILHKLGTCAFRVGREEESERHLRRALKIQEEKLESRLGHVANTLHFLGLSIIKAGRTEEAEELLRRVLVIRKKRLSDESVSLARTLYSLGVCVL